MTGSNRQLDHVSSPSKLKIDRELIPRHVNKITIS
jgi:hypothetical protein